jgi:hypothetical protein
MSRWNIPSIHFHDQPREDITGTAERRPQLGAIRSPQSPNLGQLQPEHPFRRFHRALLIPIPILLGRRLSLVATAAECLGLLLLESLLEQPFG